MDAGIDSGQRRPQHNLQGVVRRSEFADGIQRQIGHRPVCLQLARDGGGEGSVLPDDGACRVQQRLQLRAADQVPRPRRQEAVCRVRQLQRSAKAPNRLRARRLDRLAEGIDRGQVLAGYIHLLRVRRQGDRALQHRRLCGRYISRDRPGRRAAERHRAASRHGRGHLHGRHGRRDRSGPLG